VSLSRVEEKNLATTLAAILIAVATFSLTIMGIASDATTSISNEIFGLLGLSSLLTSALIIDSILDKAQCSPKYRLTELMNGGYVLFSIIMAGMSFGIFFIYLHQEAPEIVRGFSYLYISYAVSSFCLFTKLMWDASDRIFAFLLALSYIVSITVSVIQ